MIPKHLPIPLLALLASTGALAADDHASSIDDRQIKWSFENKLGELQEEGKTVPPEELIEQLEARRSAHIDLPMPKPGDLDAASVYEQARAGVLCFGSIYKCEHCDKWHGSIAGGFVISDDGLAVTNYHVMKSEKAGAFAAMDIDGTLYPVEEVVAASRKDDLAIVRLQGDGFRPIPVATGDTVGAEVTVISHPDGRFYTVSEGIISRYFRSPNPEDDGAPRMSITADFAKGSSGAPVLNDDGAVVGVIEATNSIYYDKKKGVPQNLQMVIKSCIPSASIRKLLSAAE